MVVTGYLSRSFTWSGRNLRRLVTAVALPYVLFEAAMAGFRTGLGGEQLDQLFLDPHWPMWYLATLFLWRLVHRSSYGSRPPWPWPCWCACWAA